jgi:hypothetical protein
MEEQGGSKPKCPWERPTVRLAGTIALLVRGGSAQGKPGGDFDGDMNQFLARGQQ